MRGKIISSVTAASNSGCIWDVFVFFLKLLAHFISSGSVASSIVCVVFVKNICLQCQLIFYSCDSFFCLISAFIRRPLGDHLATTWQPLGNHLATNWSHLVTTWITSCSNKNAESAQFTPSSYERLWVVTCIWAGLIMITMIKLI